jgi:hypothetical protein
MYKYKNLCMCTSIQETVYLQYVFIIRTLRADLMTQEDIHIGTYLHGHWPAKA